MAISSISRNVTSQDMTASANVNVDSDQVLADATSGAITCTLYAVTDGALHQVIVQKTDSGGNAVSVTDGGSFTFSLSAQYDAVICQTTDDGVWFGVSGFDRSGTGDVEGPASATNNDLAAFDSTTGKLIKDSGVATTQISTNASTAASATLSGTSATASVAASAILSGTSATASVAASATLSGVSATASNATSQNVAQSTQISTLTSAVAS